MELDNFKYNLTALKKCDQTWDEMKPIFGGRLCAKCDKKIIDFSKMTHSEIAFYMANRSEPICGFYLPEQLPQMTKKKINLPIVVGLSTLLTTSQVYTQTTEIAKSKSYQTNEQKLNDFDAINKTKKTASIDTVYIHGKIQTFDSVTMKVEPIGFASIIIKGTKLGVAANENGEFLLRFHPTKDSGTLTLLLGAVTFKAKQVEIEYTDQPQIDLGIISMQKDTDIIEYYVVTKKRSKLGKLWLKITKPFRK